MQEFRTMLASRLLAVTDYNTDRDVRYRIGLIPLQCSDHIFLFYSVP
jgi:hypothetical protein